MEPKRSPERSSSGRQRKTSLGRDRKQGQEASLHSARSRPGISSVEGIAGLPRGSTAVGSGSGSASRSSVYPLTSHATTSSSLVASRRAQHLLGADDRLIIDIGARVTKAGYSGEARPRAVVRSAKLATPIDQAEDTSSQGLAWTLDIARCKDDVERKVVIFKLRARLKALLRALFFEAMLQDPKQRKIVIVENAFMPSLVRQILRDILFNNLQVSAISFVPSHLMSAIAIGRVCCMILDLGYEQATLIPINLWRPLVPGYLLTSPRAGKRISERLKALLLHFGHFIASTDLGTGLGALSIHQLKRSKLQKERIPPELLDEGFLDDVKAKALLISPTTTETPQSILRKGQKTDWASRGAEPVSENEDEEWMQMLHAKYAGPCKVQDMTIEVPSTKPAPLAPAHQPSTLGLAPAPTRRARGAIVIPGWIRERAAEILFEPGDDDELSLTEIVLHALLKVPVDLRRPLANNIYVTGGSAMLPGVAHRLRLEIVRALSSASTDMEANGATRLALTRPTPAIRTKVQDKPKRIPKQSIESVSPGAGDETFLSAKPDVGEESFVTSAEPEVNAIAVETGQERRKISQSSLAAGQAKRLAPLAALAPHVAVVNDHAPRLQPDGHPVGGAAPSFPVNLAPWIGASLICSLRLDATDHISREEWEEAQERARRLRAEAQQGAHHGERPGLGLGRGSFLGTIGGLDLGTYGPLSAGARGSKFSAGGTPLSPTGSR